MGEESFSHFLQVLKAHMCKIDIIHPPLRITEYSSYILHSSCVCLWWFAPLHLGDTLAAVTCVPCRYPRRCFMTDRLVRLYLSAWLLTVNMKLLFSQHSSGEGNPCVFVFVQRGDTEQSEGWERCWEWRQITHHLIMLECATTLCIVSVALVIAVVIGQAVRTERAWWEGRRGRQFDGEENNPHFGFLRSVKLWINLRFMTKMC